MVVTRIGGRIVLVDSSLARVVEDGKIKVYSSERDIAANKKPTAVYVAEEARKYAKILLDKITLSGSKADIDQLIKTVNS